VNEDRVKSENDEMPKLRRHRSKQESKPQIAHAMKQRLIWLISVLTAMLLVLLFRIAEAWWTEWMIDHRKQIIGGLLLAIICIIALSPLIIEADSNPRALSGPGKNPKGPRLE
jgi:hypothetical protein